MSAPSYEPAPVPRRRRHGGVVGPLILIFIGGVVLLENTGHLPPNTWLSLWRLWPLILVLGGLELLFAHRMPWLVLAGLVAVVMGAGVFMTTFNPLLTRDPVEAPISAETDLSGATQAAVTVRFGAGQLNVGPLVDPAPQELAVMTYTGPSGLAPVPHYSAAAGGAGQLEYQTTDRSGQGFLPFVGGRSDTTRLDVNLNPSVPIPLLDVQTGATDAHLDLSGLDVHSLEMSVGAAATWIRLPQVDGTTTAHITGGASSLTIEVPQGVALQLRHRGGLSNLSIDQNRFPSVGGGVYRSPDYAQAQKKIDVNLETGLTSIQVS